MPLVSRTFDQLIDFTRTSAATYVDASGRIVPTPASRNLLTFTQEFDNAGWARTDATIVANAAVAPDGTLTADKLAETAINGAFVMVQSPTMALNTMYSFSCYMKAAERSFGVLNIFTGTASCWTWYNLSTGTISTLGAGATATITPAGNGWYRCTLTISTAASGSPNIAMWPSTANGVLTYTGTAGSGIFIWGAQLEAGSTATDYTRNNDGVYPPRFDYDPVTLAPKGLLVEEQRTNLLLRSEEFDGPSWTPTNLTVTANSTTSPDGTVDADTLNEGTVTGVHSVAQVFSATTGTSYALSVYLKNGDARYAQLFFGSAGHGSTAFANFDLQSGTVGTVGATATASIQSAGGGWYRCTIVAAATATTASASAQIGVITSSTSPRAENYTGASKFIYAWGIQTEAGAFATSYIPTVASQVTRTADVATITGANFSQWYNQSEGTFVAQFDMIGGSAANTNNQIVLSPIADASNRHIIYNGDAEIAGYTVVGGVTQAYLPMGSLAANTTSKMAYAYQVNNFAASQNGGAVSTDTSGSLPVPTRLGIGSGGLGGNQLNGHIRSIRYYPTRLSNAQLQALTA